MIKVTLSLALIVCSLGMASELDSVSSFLETTQEDPSSGDLSSNASSISEDVQGQLSDLGTLTQNTFNDIAVLFANGTLDSESGSSTDRELQQIQKDLNQNLANIENILNNAVDRLQRSQITLAVPLAQLTDDLGEIVVGVQNSLADSVNSAFQTTGSIVQQFGQSLSNLFSVPTEKPAESDDSVETQDNGEATASS